MSWGHAGVVPDNVGRIIKMLKTLPLLNNLREKG